MPSKSLKTSSKATMPLKSSKAKASSMITKSIQKVEGLSNEQFKDDHAFEEFKDDHEFQRRLGTLENVFDREMKSECIQTYYMTCYKKTSFQIRFHFREDCVLWRTFSFGKCRVNVFKPTKGLGLLGARPKIFQLLSNRLHHW